MKEAFEIARIIQKSLKGKLSESEERQLSGWKCMIPGWPTDVSCKRSTNNVVKEDF